LQVFRHIGLCLTATQIARCLNCRAHTVEPHRKKIKAKKDLTTADALNRAAVQWLLENG
jgi:DNA-binding CsgD family transcriptional regulator